MTPAPLRARHEEATTVDVCFFMMIKTPAGNPPAAGDLAISTRNEKSLSYDLNAATIQHYVQIC